MFGFGTITTQVSFYRLILSLDSGLYESDYIKIDPNNAETQNYLGMVLSERGLRTDAEKAFRNAVKIDPNYLVAHYNLAILYATKKPAYPRLANYHYQKAISLGASPNPEFEKTLQESLNTVEENNTQIK